MAVGVNRKISAASARSHTRRSKQGSSSKLPSGIFTKILLVLFVGILAWAYQAIQPPPPKTCGSPEGPPVTAPRIKLRDGRHLAYKEHGVSKDVAKFKIIYLHPFRSSRHCASFINGISPEVVEELGIYIISFDRPGYGESDPHPKMTLKSLSLDIEELADQLGLGSKFYIVGYSMGGQFTWSCLKYIPHRLAGVSLLAPVINYWWPGFPANLSKESYDQQPPPDRWALRIAHYAPWLTYWWNTQKWFPASSFVVRSPDIYSYQDKEIMGKLMAEKNNKAKVAVDDGGQYASDFHGNWLSGLLVASSLEYAIQQGESESIYRDMIIAFSSWEFDPMDLSNPLPYNEGSIHLWQGDEDRVVPVVLQQHIAKKLSWINYHEVPGGGHMFPFVEGMSNTIVKVMVTKES